MNSFNSILPNMRWLCLPSEVNGEDWWELGQALDDRLSELGMDLAEESVYLLYRSGSPCLVARSVIGPIREMALPLQRIDWKSAPVHRKTLTGQYWDELFREVMSEGQSIGREGDALFFMLCLRRRLSPELTLSVEVIFSE